MIEQSPWHAGEVAMQRSAGVAARMDEIGRRTIRDYLLPQHRDFFPLLQMVVLGAVDARGDAWATVRTGHHGFLRSPDEHRLHVDLRRDPSDPAEAGLEEGASAALLGIDLTTRRRNRLNGTVARDAHGFALEVVQSFGNCPKYIQRRAPLVVSDPAGVSDVEPAQLDALGGAALELVRRSDTLFVTSYVETPGGQRSVDVSHRGGQPGFVRMDDRGFLIPDYAGNMYFNTLGNLLANPRAGVTLVDFETGDLLQMSGRAEVLGSVVDPEIFPGAERLWRFQPERIVWRQATLALSWQLEEWSPFLPKASA
jgi:predicted pyridoxine 5'-phosphate oxidase superfamily flavin-nucleotide-binding protein